MHRVPSCRSVKIGSSVVRSIERQCWQPKTWIQDLSNSQAISRIACQSHRIHSRHFCSKSDHSATSQSTDASGDSSNSAGSASEGGTDQEKREPGNYLEEEFFRGKTPLNLNMKEPTLPNLEKKEKLTPLAEELKRTIHAKGPITLASFMERCMQDPKYGYYMTKDPIGREGDFITTPEMFSGFSECIAVWCAHTWEALGKPDKIRIIEFGPGLGTVAKAILDFSRHESLAPFRKALQIHLVESSPRLRFKQKTRLGLPSIRKFQQKVRKPVWAAHVDPYKTPESQGDIVSTETVPLDSEDLAASATKKSTKTSPLIRPKVEKEHKLADKLEAEMRARGPTPSQASQASKSGAFSVDKVFGGMSQIGAKMGGSLTQEAKDKLPPFDWSLHNPEVVGKMDPDMKKYFSGQATEMWNKAHGIPSGPTVASDPLSQGFKSKDEFSGSKREREAKAALAARHEAEVRQEGAAYQTASQQLDSALYEEKLQSLLNNLGSGPTTDTTVSLPNASGPGGADDAKEGNRSDAEEKAHAAQQALNFEDLLNYEDLERTSVEENEEIWQARTKENILISWHNSLQSIDPGPALFIAHEFFDALPVNHFEFQRAGWCETLVDVDEREDSKHHFQLVRGNIATVAGAVLDRHFAKAGIQPHLGQQFSFMPNANEIASDMARWCNQHGGAGFIVDYGSLNPPPWTLQAVKGHKPCDMVSMPGEVDISAHVNFGQLKASIEQNNDGIKCFGPVTQSYFLQGCGIVHRFRHYINDLANFGGDEKEREKFIETFGRVMDIDKLGGHFKVLGFGSESMTTPIGFREPVPETTAKKDDRGIPVYEG